MKKISSIFILTLTILFVFTGCKEAASKLTQIRIPYSTQFTLPANLPIINTPYPVAAPTIPINTEATLKAMGYKMDLVERFEIEKIEMELNSPDDGDLNFFKSIQIFIEAPGLDRVLIAEKTIPDSETKLTKIDLDCKKINLLEYFKKDEITLSASLTTDQVIMREHVIDAKLGFMVDVKVLGL